MNEVHAERREPAEPSTPLDLDAAAQDLLASATQLASGRSARTLTPGAGARLKQTMIALTAGSRTDDHVAPEWSTIQVLRGSVTLVQGEDDGATGERVDLEAGQWATLPSALHRLEARDDAVALVSTAPDT